MIDPIQLPRLLLQRSRQPLRLHGMQYVGSSWVGEACRSRVLKFYSASSAGVPRQMQATVISTATADQPLRDVGSAFDEPAALYEDCRRWTIYLCLEHQHMKRQTLRIVWTRKGGDEGQTSQNRSLHAFKDAHRQILHVHAHMEHWVFWLCFFGMKPRLLQKILQKISLLRFRLYLLHIFIQLLDRIFTTCER